MLINIAAALFIAMVGIGILARMLDAAIGAIDNIHLPIPWELRPKIAAVIIMVMAIAALYGMDALNGPYHPYQPGITDPGPLLAQTSKP